MRILKKELPEWIPAFAGMTDKRYRNDREAQILLPASRDQNDKFAAWIPAFAGMTDKRCRNDREEISG